MSEESRIDFSLVFLNGKTAGGTSVSPVFSTEDIVLEFTPGTPVQYKGRVEQPALLRRDMYGPGRTMGEIQISSGVIELANADGELDYLGQYAFDGLGFSVRHFQLGGALAGTGLTGFIEQPTFDDEKVTFQVRDALHAFDVTLLPNKYAGTNVLPAGVEGTAADIKGQYKPLLMGTCRNVVPVCVNTSKQIYQLDGVRGFVTGYTIAVYDKRAVLTKGADYSSQADMEATAPTAGQYRVWPAGGMFRTNAAHTLLTCDVFNPHQASGTDDLDDIVGRLIFTTLAVYPFANFVILLPATPGVGIYLQDGRTLLQALVELSVSCQLFLTTGRRPQDLFGSSLDLWGSCLTDPANMPYTPALDIVELNEFNIVERSLKRVVPSEPTRGLPVWRVTLRYAKNYRVMSATDLAGVALSELATWSQEYLTVTAEDTGVKTQWPNAPELNVTTLLADATEAQAEADRLLDLFSVNREMFTLQIPGIVAPTEPGSARPRSQFQIGVRVRITFDRYGLDAGKLFIVTGMKLNLETDTYDLTVWG